MNDFLIHICIKMMPGVRSIAMISVRTTIYTYYLKNLSGAPCSHFRNFLLFILRKTLVDQNDVEFDFSRGQALAMFPFL